MANKYTYGTEVRCSVEFKDWETNLPIDPDTVTFRIRSPAGVITPYIYGIDVEVIRTAVGFSIRSSFSPSRPSVAGVRAIEITRKSTPDKNS